MTSTVRRAVARVRPRLLPPKLSASNPVVIDRVLDLREGRPRRPEHRSLGMPREGSAHPSFGLALSGWSLDRSSPAVALEASAEGELIHRIPVAVAREKVARKHPDVEHAARSGFATVLGTLSLPEAFELDLTAVLENGERLPVWRLRGRRRRALDRSDAPSPISPIAINALGRTGSSWLTYLLNLHPAIVVYRPFHRDARVAGYWVEVFRRLSEPRTYLGALGPRADHPHWWLGEDREPVILPPGHGDFDAELGHRAVTELAQFCRHRAQQTYVALARQVGKPDASWFAEKSVGYDGAGKVLKRYWDELYPDARELLLVRDPRDVVCSMIAYDRRRGGGNFGRDRVGDEREFMERLREALRLFGERHRQLGERSLVVRYEDLVGATSETLSAVFAHLSIDSSADVVKRVMEEAASQDTEEMRRHRTARDARASIGRWRNDLPPEDQALAHEVFADELATYGYAS